MLFLSHGAVFITPTKLVNSPRESPMPLSSQLSRRERQIMDIVYELGEASAKDMETHHCPMHKIC